MDIITELKKSAKWSKVNAYGYLFSGLLSGVSTIILAILFLVYELKSNPIPYFFVGSIFIIISLTAYYLFRQYHRALQTAIQSLSSDTLEKAFRYQSCIFIFAGIFYLFVVLMITFFIMTGNLSKL